MKDIETNTIQNIARIVLGLLMAFAASGTLPSIGKSFRHRFLIGYRSVRMPLLLSPAIFELSLGLGMIFWSQQKVSIGLSLAIFYILIFPGNIAQYVNGTDAFGLDTDQARLIRLFFQPVLVLWALWSTVPCAICARENIPDLDNLIHMTLP